jgi:hypothetical protein
MSGRHRKKGKISFLRPPVFVDKLPAVKQYLIDREVLRSESVRFQIESSILLRPCGRVKEMKNRNRSSKE